MPTPVAFLPVRGFIGLASELVHGTPLAAKVYAPILDDSLALDPGIVLDHLIRASKDVAYNPVAGEQKIEGNINTLLWLDSTLMLFGASIGTDTWQTGGATTGSGAIGTNVAVGATTVSLTAQTATPLVAGDYIELRQSSPVASATNLSEIHKVLTVTGAGPYTIAFAAGETTFNAYTSATGVAYRIAAGSPSFKHAVYPDLPTPNTWKTITIEKNYAGIASQQYAGSIVSKASLKFTTKDTARATYDFFCAGQATISATTPSFSNALPLALNNYTISVFGTPDTSVISFDVDIDNMGKGIWTFSGSNLPTIALPTGRKIGGKWTNIAQDLTYYNSMAAVTQGAVVLTATQGSESLVLTFPQCVINKGALPLKIGDAMIYDISFDAVFSNSIGNSISALVTSTSLYLPLC